MKNIMETLFCGCVLAILTGTSLAQLDQSSDESSRDDADGKRGWNMLRWGRGLQMLRLGKRSPNVDSLGFWRQGRSMGSHNSRLSAYDIQDLLDSIFDEARDDTRRQPPLPRYGRDSGSSRPAPRGGRYRRAIPTDSLAFDERSSPRDSGIPVAFPRTEQAMNRLENLQTQMVPRSNEGGNQNEASDDSDQSQSV